MYGVTSMTSTLLHQPIASLLLIVSVGICALDSMYRCNRRLLSSARRQVPHSQQWNKIIKVRCRVVVLVILGVQHQICEKGVEDMQIYGEDYA